MPLKLIHGPPNSGRAGRIRRGLIAVLDRDPVLVVPTLDDVYAFERELCANGAVLGADVMTFGGLFRAVATAGGAPPGAVLTPAQRLGAVAAAVSARRAELGPLRGSALQSGFPMALEQLLDELQGAGLEPADVEATAGTLEGSAYLGDIAALFAGYARVRDGLGTVDAHDIARDAIDLLGSEGGFWRRPVFLYGLDDLTPNQLGLIRGLASIVEVTVALPYETRHTALEARNAPLLDALEQIGIDSVEETDADPGNTDSPLLFQLERGFGETEPERRPLDGSLVFLRSAGERGEAEAIAVEVARLLADRCEAEQIAIVVRDPGRRGPLIASILESYGIPTALEAEIPASTTSVGGSLIALLEAVLGTGRAADLLRYLRGPSGTPSGRVDWFERKLRRERVQTAAAALRLWEEKYGEPQEAVARLRESAGRPADLASEVGALAAAMGARVGSEMEARTAAAISTALSERAALDGLAPLPEALARALAGIRVRVWSGPVEDRVRIADPRRVRAARFDNVFVASLQDGEFPRGAAHTDPFLSEGQRESLGLPPRHDSNAEERYLFHVCLALPRRRLFLSYRDSDENGGAEAPSPFVEDVRQMLEPAEGGLRGRGLAEVVHSVADAPSETELARAIAAVGTRADIERLLKVAGAGDAIAARVRDRLASARSAETATRAPGPLANPAVIAALGDVHAYGGTTLEGFDLCSYRWFVSHELSPQPLDPAPDPLVQGGIVHAALYSLYKERPGGYPLPRPASLAAWIARSRELVGEIAAARGLGEHPAERAMLARIEGLLARFLAEEAQREIAGFEPWLLEAGFSESEEVEQPTLEIDGWRLHGAIDRVDRAADGRALVLDYKLSGKVSPRVKLEEEAKLQLQLYLIAVAELWGAEIVGGLYHPLRATSERRPRGLVLEDAATELAGYGLAKTDSVDREEFDELLAAARRRAGEIVARMRTGQIDRDPGPREGLRNHGICPAFCDFAPICRRDRAPVEPVSDEEDDER
ncbi:MAG TPA: PD-(D/E)XK nuclease family protein [Solirubrobacterales bacterium]|jgi:ATP-dependent helicase/DNAse subunit B|nr:PD-(D/E)XK nuclease family protein [Solirubrobacterales bacterium]